MGIHLGIWNFKSFQALEGDINWGMILDGRSTGNGGNSKFSQMSYIQKVVIHSTCAFKIGLELYSGLAGWQGSPKYCSIYCCCKDFGWISHFCVIFQYFSILFNIFQYFSSEKCTACVSSSLACLLSQYFTAHLRPSTTISKYISPVLIPLFKCPLIAQ